MTPELEALARRVEELEKQVAHLAAVVTEQSDPDRAVEARSFVVRDEQGQRRAELGMVIPVGLGEAHPWLGLFDANERARACIGVEGIGPWFELYNEKGNVGVEIRLDEGNPTLRLFSENGKPTVAVQTSEHGPFVALFNKREGAIEHKHIFVGCTVACHGRCHGR